MSTFSFDDLERISNNPNRVISKIYDLIEADLDSSTVGGLNGSVDPFTFAIDAIVGNNHVYLTRLADAVARGYEVHARNISDLSNHMSDEDWDGVFAEPSKTTLRFLIPVTEIDRAAITYETFDHELLNFYKKLVIPKDTLIKVVDTYFWLEHAVEIRIMEHGGIQVLYDTTQTSPFQTLGTNYPEREFITLSTVKHLAVYLPVRQIAIKEIPNKASNNIVGFSFTHTFDDKLYKIRAFIQPWNSNQRVEMTVIFNRDSYDPAYPTMTIDLVDDNQFVASIPTVYLENGLGIGDVTLLVYTTKGAYQRDLRTIGQNYYSPAFYNYNNPKGALNEYEAPFKTIDGLLVSCTAPITGGVDSMTFDQLKQLKIYDHRKREVPISNIDLTQKFSKAGYSMIKSIDYPNSRLYRVTKSIPKQDTKSYEDEQFITFNSSLGIFVGPILTSINELVALGVGKLNGYRYTLLPGTIFEISDNKAVIWSDLERRTLLNASAQTKIDTTTTRTLVANPYYYVLDTTNDQVRLRPYYLDEPSIVEQTFFYENPYLGINIGVSKDGITIYKKEDGSGYRIELVTLSSDVYKEIDDEKLGVQIAFDVNEGSAKKTARGYLLGKNENKERKWAFDLDTDWDIDHNNNIYFKGFRQFGISKDTVTASLNQSISFIFTYEGDSTKEKSTADLKIDQSLFDTQVTAIVETEFNVEFGRYLNHLYYSVRPMVGALKYKTYEQDVLLTYTENLFKYENGELVVEDGKAVVLHRKGEVIKDDDGTATLAHRKGDIVRDDEGNPVPLDVREIKYYWEFVAFDYNYLLSQDDYDTDYYDQVKSYIAVDVMDEISVLGNTRLERTLIFFKPKSTIGYTSVVINESQEVEIKNDLQFSVVYYLTKEGYVDRNLKSTLRVSTHKEINNLLVNNTISRSDFVTALRNISDGNIVEVGVTVGSGSRTIEVASNVDTTNGFAVRKKLTVTGDGFLTIEEDIDVGFREHRKKDSNTVTFND